MNLEDFEFIGNGIIYEVYDGIIWRDGRETDIRFLGACPSEAVEKVLSDYLSRGKSIQTIAISKDCAELFFDEELDMGELEKEVKVGSCIVGKPSKGEYKK